MVLGVQKSMNGVGHPVVRGVVSSHIFFLSVVQIWLGWVFVLLAFGFGTPGNGGGPEWAGL